MDTYVPLIAGLALLILGGELLVRGAVRTAQSIGVSPLLIGLTLVGFGTSTPELVTSVQAAISGSPGIAIGNIVGSNISNLLLILGLSALLTPIAVSGAALKRDGAIMLAAAVAFVAIGWTLPFAQGVGAVLLALLLGYLVYAWMQERTAPEAGHTSAFEKAEAYEELHERVTDRVVVEDDPARAPRGRIPVAIAMALLGLVIVVAGGKLLVDGAVSLARTFAISETVIGLTIVAVGTSMPEFVTSVVAAARGHSAVALGNILGSNIYNTLGIGGATALISPTRIPPEILQFDGYVMIAASLAALLFSVSGMRINRLEGAFMLAGYAGYIWWLWPR